MPPKKREQSSAYAQFVLQALHCHVSLRPQERRYENECPEAIGSFVVLLKNERKN